jgi:excisionase family DNA binding protein
MKGVLKMSEKLTTKDLCKIYKVTKTTIENWRREGMPFEKLGKIVRFNQEEVEQWLKNR